MHTLHAPVYLLFSSLVVNKGRLVQTLKCLGTLLGLRQFMLHTLILFTIFFKSVNKREGKRREERERKNRREEEEEGSKKEEEKKRYRIREIEYVTVLLIIASLELGH